MSSHLQASTNQVLLRKTTGFWPSSFEQSSFPRENRLFLSFRLQKSDVFLGENVVFWPSSLQKKHSYHWENCCFLSLKLEKKTSFAQENQWFLTLHPSKSKIFLRRQMISGLKKLTKQQHNAFLNIHCSTWGHSLHSSQTCFCLFLF